jgi:hypothetical protein
MFRKILTGSIIALAIIIGSLAGNGGLFRANAALADTYPINSVSCATVTFSAWGNCINGVKSRDVIDKTPVGCYMSSNEMEARSQVCGQVLGVKIYAVGTLLRTPQGKIFVVMSGQTIQLVPDLDALQAYRGRTIYNVSDALISQYQLIFGQVLGAKIYADGTLLRGSDHRIYVIVHGQKQYISSLTELYQYRNRRIINVSASVIDSL